MVLITRRNFDLSPTTSYRVEVQKYYMAFIQPSSHPTSWPDRQTDITYNINVSPFSTKLDRSELRMLLVKPWCPSAIFLPKTLVCPSATPVRQRLFIHWKLIKTADKSFSYVRHQLLTGRIFQWRCKYLWS